MTPSPTKPGAGGRRAVLGVPVAALVEIVLLLGAALLCDALFLGGKRFHSWSHHPFWIPVLLAAVQYGTNAGLFAALAATLAILAGHIPPQTLFQDRFAWLSGMVHLPLLWFVAAVVLGELRMRHIRATQALRQELGEASRRENVLAEAYRRLNTAKDALETRLASQMRTSLALYEAAKAIEKLDPAEVLLGVSKLVKSVMNPQLRVLAKRIGFDVCMIVARIENLEELTTDQRSVTPVLFGRTVQKTLRRTDLAFDYQRPGSEFALVLPATPLEGARVVVAKLEDVLQLELAAEEIPARFSFAVQIIHDARNVEEPVEELIGV